MSIRTLDTEVFGRDVSFGYSETWVGYSLLSMRLVMAYVFLSAGVQKLLDPEWTAASYLEFAVHENNPFTWLWPELAGVPLVDAMNVYGQILIGLALMVGGFVRFAAFMGALMMLLFWASSLQGGLFAGLPVENGYVVTYHVVYALVLFGLGAFGAGRILGLDERLEEIDLVRERPVLRLFLG